MNPRQSSRAFNFILINIIMAPAQYCSSCQFPYKQMGACPNPQTSIIYSYLSFLPYMVIWVLLVVLPFTRNRGQYKLLTLIVSAYLIGDKILKNIVQSPRPEFSCKTSYGMPSSHMIVMVVWACFMMRRQGCGIIEKCFWVLLSVAQGVARMELVYHTLPQVVTGAAFGAIYAYLYDILFQKLSGYFVGSSVGKILFPSPQTSESHPEKQSKTQ